MSLKLTANEQKLLDRIENLIAQIAGARGDDAKKSQRQQDIKTLGMECQTLHKSLTARGHEPRHKAQMIANRCAQPSDPTFYEHTASAEHLLAFIADPESAGDPPDVTIGAKFTFSISRGARLLDTYTIKRTGEGWDVNHISIGGDCDKTGHPFLYENLQHDSINYPSGLPYYFQSLWDMAKVQGLPATEVQAALTQLADWISSTHRASPQGLFASR